METLLRSLNYDLQFDKDAQHILENSRNIDHSIPSTTTTASATSANSIALSSTPTITSLDSLGSLHSVTTTTDFLHKLGASFINSIQLTQSPLHLPVAAPVAAVTTEHIKNMDFSLSPPHIVIDTDSYGPAMDELQKQVEYDKFMNEVWIGIVLTLILISMVFCFCSCFLYHQFRVWKRNYRTTLTQSSEADSVKISMDIEDPVPEYTLVSGLPSYEAALELLHKNPQSCLIVHPSVFEVFNRKENSPSDNTPTASSGGRITESSDMAASVEAAQPLLNEQPTTPKTPQVFIAALPSYHEATTNAAAAGAASISLSPLMPYNHSFTSLSLMNEKSQFKNSSSTFGEKSSPISSPPEKTPKS